MIKHLKRVWWFLWHPEYLDQYDRLAVVLQHPVRPSVQYAVEKTAADPAFHPTKNHAHKHRETLEWTTHAVKEGWKGYQSDSLPTWETMFLIEWEIGVRKGKL
jgi:hypothetical protein